MIQAEEVSRFYGMMNRSILLFCLLLFCLLASMGVRQMNISSGIMVQPDKLALSPHPESGRAVDGDILVDISRQTDDLPCPHLAGLSLYGGPDASLVCNHGAGALSPQGKDHPPLLHTAVSLRWSETFGVRSAGQGRWCPSIPKSRTPPPR